jgi:opacity protein-like surface antigen
MKWLSRACVAVAIAVAVAAQPAAGQRRASDRSFQWYWGAQGGAFYYQTAAQPYYYDPIVGGHWLITARRTALYLAYEQAVFLTPAVGAIFDPSAPSCSVGTQCRDVEFSDMRRIMFGVVAFPLQKAIEPFAGGGFAMMQVLDPIVDCSTCISSSEQFEAQERAEDASSKAFFWLMGGLQINVSKLSLFGHYVLTSSAAGFLIQGTTHSFQAGLRYSFGSAKEGIEQAH